MSGCTSRHSEIRVYDNRLCIWDPGVLPESWTVRKLFTQHSSCPYNPLVANAFFRAGEIEAWGRGMQRIAAACKAAGLPAPKVSYAPSDLWFEFSYAPDYLKALSAPTVQKSINAGTSVETSVETSVKTPDRMLQILAHHPEMTLAQVAAEIGKSQRAIEMACAKLIQTKRLKHVGPKKGGHWEVLK